MQAKVIPVLKGGLYDRPQHHSDSQIVKFIQSIKWLSDLPDATEARSRVEHETLKRFRPTQIDKPTLVRCLRAAGCSRLVSPSR